MKTMGSPPVRQPRSKHHMSMGLSDKMNSRFTDLIQRYGGSLANRCLHHREQHIRRWWLIGDVVAWCIDVKLRSMTPFREASQEDRKQILDIVDLLEGVMLSTGAYDAFNTTPFPSYLNWNGLGECQLEQDLHVVCGPAQLYHPRTQRLMILYDHPATEIRQLLGSTCLWFEKLISKERECRYAVLIDQAVLMREATSSKGIPGVDTPSPTVDLLTERVMESQSNPDAEPHLPEGWKIEIILFKDRAFSYETTPDPLDNLSSLNVALQKVFEMHHEQPQLPLNVLVIVGQDPTRTEAIVSLFSSRINELVESPEGSAPEDSNSLPEHTVLPCFSFLQTGAPGAEPGMFECCREDGLFCSRILTDTHNISPALVEVLRPSVMAGDSLHEFLKKHLPSPSEGLPRDPIGGYRVSRRNTCVPSSSGRPCVSSSRLCGTPKGCILQ